MPNNERTTNVGSDVKQKREESDLATRREALMAGAAVAAGSLAKPAIAANEPVRIGYLPALTGPSSATGVGIIVASSWR